jgi:plasmid stability protein
MPAIAIRNLSEETHRALKHRAKLKGTSTEAEIRAILEEAVLPKDRLKLGTELAAFVRKYGPIEFERDPGPTEPAEFE